MKNEYFSPRFFNPENYGSDQCRSLMGNDICLDPDPYVVYVYKMDIEHIFSTKFYLFQLLQIFPCNKQC